MIPASDPEQLNAKGIALAAAGDRAGAQLCYRAAISLAPAFVAAIGNLGNLEAEAGVLETSCRRYTRALASAPLLAGLHLMLGTARLRLGQDDLGRRSLLRAIDLQPGYPKAHANLGLRDLDLGRIKEAERHFRLALEGDPNLALALAGLSRSLSDQARSREARSMARRALALAPAAADALAAAGQAAVMAGQHELAKTVFRRASAADPAPSALKGLMLYLHYDPEATTDDIYRLHRRWATSLPSVVERPPTNAAQPDRRLRIGYVSADLFDHPVGRTVVGLLENHDRSVVEAFVYAERTEEDPVNARLRKAATVWRATASLDDRALAAAIRRDEIDILVFLAGHTFKNRLAVAALRPAPVQVSMYDFGTSGLDAVDWVLSDEVLSPASGEERFSERIFRLAGLHLHMPIEAVPSRQTAAGAVVFGSCSNPVKLNDRVIATWARILDTCRDSRLLLKYRDAYSDQDLVRDLRRRFAAAEEAAVARFAAHGVSPARIVFDGRRTARRAHLEVVGGFDVALDPFPFNGCTTTYEALWMGVPVVALLGSRLLGRMSAGMLGRVGLGDLIADDEAAYVDVAVRLAGDVRRRDELRRTLRNSLKASRLLDAAAYARDVEAAYRSMWTDWCARRSMTEVQRSTSAAS